MSVTNSLTVTDCQTVTCQESSLCSLFVRYVWINVLHIELMLSPLVPLTEQINVSLMYWFRGQNNTAQMKTLWRARIKAVHKWLPTNLSELKQCAFRQENVLLNILYAPCELNHACNNVRLQATLYFLLLGFLFVWGFFLGGGVCYYLVVVFFTFMWSGGGVTWVWSM